MPFKLFYLSSYERCLKKLGSHERHIAGIVFLALKSYFEYGFSAKAQPYIFHHEHHSYRLVFKKLRDPIWEAYVEGKLRVLTCLEKGAHLLVFAGNHDQVRQFLKEQ